MKESITILVLLITISSNQLIAQDNNQNPREKLTVGLKAGLNFSNVWDEQGQDFQADGKVGFIAGAFVGIPIGEWIGVQPEVHISQKGMQASGTLLFTPYTFTRTTTYLDIPLLFQLKPSDYITLVAGPQFSYLLHEKNVYTFGSNSAQQEQEFNNEDPRKNILGFTGGIDVNIQNIVISARASCDFQNNNGNGTSTTPRYKNQLVQLTVGFKI
jgi:hypothetical protein